MLTLLFSLPRLTGTGSITGDGRRSSRSGRLWKRGTKPTSASGSCSPRATARSTGLQRVPERLLKHHDPEALSCNSLNSTLRTVLARLHISDGGIPALPPSNPFCPTRLGVFERYRDFSVSASLKRIHFRRFGVGHLARRRVRNTPVRWLLRWHEQVLILVFSLQR
jgi:hypothetical protein